MRSNDLKKDGMGYFSVEPFRKKKDPNRFLFPRCTFLCQRGVHTGHQAGLLTLTNLAPVPCWFSSCVMMKDAMVARTARCRWFKFQHTIRDSRVQILQVSCMNKNAGTTYKFGERSQMFDFKFYAIKKPTSIVKSHHRPRHRPCRLPNPGCSTSQESGRSTWPVQVSCPA